MRWSRLAAIPLGAALLLTAIPATTAFADSNQTGTEAAATAPAPPQPAGPVPSVDVLEAQMLSMINAERADVGVGPVQPIDWAHSVAVQHSQDMAAAGDIWHNIAGFIDQGRSAMRATYLGENVAMDSTLAADDALLYSDIPHRTVLLDARFNYVGVGIALDSKNWVYVTEDFAQIPGVAPTAAVTTIRPVTTRPVATRALPAAKAPVAAVIRPAVTTAPITTTKSLATASVPAAPVGLPAKPPAAAPPPQAQVIGAKAVSHSSPLNGGVWVLLGLMVLLAAAFAARRSVAILGPPGRRQRPTVPAFSFGSAARSREMWRPAA